MVHRLKDLETNKMKVSSQDRKKLIQQAVTLIALWNEFLEIDAMDDLYNTEKGNMAERCHDHIQCSITMTLKLAGFIDEQIDGFIELHSQKT
jgi:hypothetical protein